MNSLHHHFSFQLLTLLVPSRSNPSLCTYRSHASSTSCSLRFHPSQKTKALKIPIEPLEFQSRNDESSKLENDRAEKNRSFQSETSNSEELHTKKEHEEEPDISGIHVPRERHILIPKKLLLEAILSIFDSQDEIDDFLRVSSCLDSILHAEHKDILEEMRLDYSVICSPELMGDATCSAKSEEKITPNGHHFPQDDSLGIERMERSGQVENSHDTSVPFHYGLDLRFLLDSSARNVRKKPDGESRVAVATRFQCAFMKLLRDAQFEELSARDLQLTSALNTDYLLTLPIYVDWKRASESNAIIFRRGYAAECQKGLLIVEKLEYLQSRLLQRIFLVLSKPLKRFGMWINEAWDNIGQKEETRIWIERLRLWLKKWAWLERVHSSDDRGSHGQQGVKEQSDSDLPIRLVAQKAVPRYEDFLSSVGPRGRLLRKFLIWVGFIPSLPETSFVLDSGSAPSEPYLRPNFLSRISLSDIWKPATKKPCGDNVWKMFQTAISVLFSRSILQEPAFRELILLYNEEVDHIEVECNAELPLLQLKIYEKIPIPDLPVIFPHRRLSFRILDTVRLDVASILGLLAFFVNYKFEDILSSPSAFLLDVIASSALIIYVTRVALGYKQTWDRYQLLVNKTLYEKTLASGFGTVHFLLDASEQQQYKEAILTYAHLLRAEKGQVTCRKHTADMCERFMYDKFKEKVEMPIDQAINTLLRLGLVKEISLEGNCILLALPCSRAYEALKQQWDCLLG